MSEEEYYSFVRRNPGIVSLDLDLDKNVLGNHILLSNCENLEILRLRCSKGSGKKILMNRVEKTRRNYTAQQKS